MSIADDARKAADLRARAARVRALSAQLAAAVPTSDQGRYLALQAEMLRAGAARIEDEALAVEPAAGEA